MLTTSSLVHVLATIHGQISPSDKHPVALGAP